MKEILGSSVKWLSAKQIDRIIVVKRILKPFMSICVLRFPKSFDPRQSLSLKQLFIDVLSFYSISS